MRLVGRRALIAGKDGVELGRVPTLLHCRHDRPWRMLLVDLRNHGHSSALHQLRPPHSIQAAAEDVVKLIGELLLPPSTHPSRCGKEGFSLAVLRCVCCRSKPAHLY